MSHRKKLALRAAVPVAVLALTLTGCGKDTADGGARTGAGPAQQDGGKGAGEAVPEEPEKKKALAEGEAVTSPFQEKEAGQVTYEIAAQKVDVGTEADAKKLVSDPAKAKGLVPVVAHVKYTHKTGKTVTDYPDVGDNVEIHADGRRGALLIGASDDAPGCESDSDIENWKPGQSHVICETYMVPVGAKEIEVRWAADEDSGEPFVWRFKTA
ncbi:hypothetical protein OG897_12805 [Streptomyces sp. NBC_00237]|uniref:hypothetical protein n=1 Tax=Streptomyces sp. NBC_00237 TaxID=2975687 RepID=UPI002252DD29|nr:hypothetical protein [Streptomyces sp. NBC_00237]MCX5202327.1 hypothetical protein [Streptomyces sp. NBC_00237]